MDWHWNSSSYPISDLRDWNNLHRIELRPDFQRREVWSDAAKISLMDTILRNIPMPKLFFQAYIREGITYRKVIDGQQRIKAIFKFLNDDLSLSRPYSGNLSGMKYSDLPKTVKEKFLSYKIDINEIVNASDDIVRDIYSRVNKYTVALNKQELRRCDYPGAFLDLSEKLAEIPFLSESKIFTPTNIRRMADVEFVSELLSLLIGGTSDKKKKLDDFYSDFSEWDKENQDEIEERFFSVISDMSIIFEPYAFNIAKTRFSQKADFYSLFNAIDQCAQKATLTEKGLDVLRKDLKFIDDNTAPESIYQHLSYYAIQCVSSANSASSRRWRSNFLKHFLVGSYFKKPPNIEGRKYFFDLKKDISYPEKRGNSESRELCPICNKDITLNDYDRNAFLTWRKTESIYQLSNSLIIHESCRDKITSDFYNFDNISDISED